MTAPHDRPPEHSGPLFAPNVLVLCGQIMAIWGIISWVKKHEKDKRHR